MIVLTLLTQVGGLAWLAACAVGRRWLSFPVLYALTVIAVQWAAPLAGREALPCRGEPLRMQSPVYCALMRNFVVPEMGEVAQDAARAVAERHPGAVTLALDGGFPFLDGFPMLPHLSHDDGRKLDFAFYHTDEAGDYVPGRTRAPLGYFAFETLDEGECPAQWPSLRWNMRRAQGWWRDAPLEPERTATLIEVLADDARVGKILIEPPLAARLGVTHPKLRFQGCRAARHDDHIHVQL